MTSMKRLPCAVVVALLFGLAACQSTPAPVGLIGVPVAFSPRLLVKTTGKLADVTAAVQAKGNELATSGYGGGAAPMVEVAPELAKLGYLAVSPGDVGIDALGNGLLTVPGVSSVEVDRRVRLVEPTGGWAGVRLVPDPKVSAQWFHAKLGDTAAWQAGFTGAGITVAVIDTGVQCGHPDLRCLSAGRDFTGSGTSADQYGHGTHVAGIAAARQNGIGGTGVAPGATILPVRVLDTDGSGYDSWIAAGIVWAADQRAQVLNISLGSDSPDPILDDALNYAVRKGALIACAAGNDGTDRPVYPNVYSGCVGVAATRKDGERGTTWTNYGVNADIAAPGDSILSTCLTSRWCQMSGTSMASPVIAGVFALALGGGVPRGQVLDQLNRTGVPQTGRLTGLRRPNVAALTAAMKAMPRPTATRVASPGPAGAWLPFLWRRRMDG